MHFCQSTFIFLWLRFCCVLSISHTLFQGHHPHHHKKDWGQQDPLAVKPEIPAAVEPQSPEPEKLSAIETKSPEPETPPAIEPERSPAVEPEKPAAEEPKPEPTILIEEADLTPVESHDLLQGSHFGKDGYYIGNTIGIDRLHVPALKMQDAGGGFRTILPGTEGTTTAWPCSLALASTWDEAVVHDVAKAIGQEFRGKGSNVLLGPGINVHRVAQNGRNFEYLSGEDPYLGSRLTIPFVRGVQEEGVMATIKHFAFNEQETNRDSESSHVDAITSWELYYPPFEAGVQAGAGAIMCSYNKVNGTYACHNPDLLQRDLRGCMGFQGLVMSDWGAMHGTDAIAAGLDVEMPGRDMANGVEGFLSGKAFKRIDPAVLKEATKHVRKAIVNVGLDKHTDECPSPPCVDLLRTNQITEERITLARKAATDSIVLLKNSDGILPLKPESVKKIAVLGAASNFTGTSGTWDANYFSGGGSSHNYGRPLVTALAGIQRRAASDEIQIIPFVDSENIPSSLDAARNADVVVLVGAATAAENLDRTSLGLDSKADELIFKLAEVNKPTIVLLQTPGVVLTPWRDHDHVKAIANIFLGGEETGNALAAVLFGDVNPGGKLPVMFPNTIDDTIQPNNDSEVVYAEGLFTSYRSNIFKAAYPFGHGLSFTTFEYGTPEVIHENCTAKACVRFELTNTGQRRGSETPQAYIEFSDRDDLEPKNTLRGFQKVWLDPEEVKTITFPFSERDMSIYRDGAWLRKKEMEVHIGTSSADIKHTIHLLSE